MSEKPIELGDELLIIAERAAKAQDFRQRLLADPVAVVGEATGGFTLTPDALRAALGLSHEDSTPVVEVLKERLSKLGFGGGGASGSWR